MSAKFELHCQRSPMLMEPNRKLASILICEFVHLVVSFNFVHFSIFINHEAKGSIPSDILELYTIKLLSPVKFSALIGFFKKFLGS